MPHSSPFQSPELVVVEASAGTGKTYALARRYVRLILQLTRGRDRAPIHSILAITFTNKAAFEMKERILRFLKELALGVMDAKEREELLAPLGMSTEEAAVTAVLVMKTIIRNYNYFCVETIDKFINTLLVSSAFQIGLTANFRIKTGAREDLALALDELIDAAAADTTVRRAFTDLMTCMLLVEARSSWIPRDVLLDTVERLFSEYNTYALPFVRGAVTPEELVRSKARAIAAVKAFSEQIPDGANKTFVQSIAKFVSSGKGAFRFGDRLSSYFYKEIPFTKALLLTQWHEHQWDLVRRAFREAADREVHHSLDPYLEIFERVRRNLVEACQREDVVFLSELNAKARMVYEQGVAPEELYYRLSTRFEHYLLDEFQDTSLLQWENLRLLPEDAIAKGGSLFYVGDKKQAIYDFRGGDTRLFDAIRAQYSDPDYHARIEYLNVSRRSHRSIVEFNNAVFDLAHLGSLLNLADDDGQRIVPARSQDQDELKRVYARAGQEVLKKTPEGCVRVAVLDGASRDAIHEDARRRTVPLLKDLRGRFVWRDICILVRRNDDVEEVTRWLLEEEIPSSSDRTMNIKEHRLVNEVVAFLRFLFSPVNDEAFAEFIQGDIFIKASGLSIDEIRDFILGWRIGRRGYLYLAFREAFPSVWSGQIEEFFRNVGLYPLYELVVSFYQRTGVSRHFSDEQGFLMHFLDLIKSKEGDYPSIALFLEHFDALEGEDLYVDIPDVNAVKVMTVHKAKGLDFRVVILPFLSMSLQKGSGPSGQALSYALRVEDGGLKLYHFNDTHAHYSDKADELSVDEDMRTFFAELNSVYVALTRAECEMYIFIPPKVRNNSRNLALDLIPERLFSVGSSAPSYPDLKKDEGASPLRLEPGEHRDWIRFLKEEFLDHDDLLRREDRVRGLAMHAILEKVGVLLDSKEATGLREAAAEAGRTMTLPEDCLPMLETFVISPGVRPFFIQPALFVYCEKEFVDRFGNGQRMDRVLVFEREVWVIDFKLKVLDARGRQQVGRYVSILREVYPDKRARGFLAALETGQVVEI